MLEGGEVGLVKHCQEMVAEGGAQILTLIVMVMVFLVLPEEFLLFKGVCLRWDGG